MANSEVSISEGNGAKKIATYNFSEDGDTKEIQRVVLNSASGAVNGVIGKVGFDHTTPGTTDLVVVQSAQIATVTGTILSGAFLSAAVDLSAGRLAAILMPGAWTAANLTFQASPDGVTYGNMRNQDGSEYVVDVTTAGDFIQVPVGDFLGVRFVKVRSGTSSASVTQAADRAITLVLVP